MGIRAWTPPRGSPISREAYLQLRLGQAPQGRLKLVAPRSKQEVGGGEEVPAELPLDGEGLEVAAHHPLRQHERLRARLPLHLVAAGRLGGLRLVAGGGWGRMALRDWSQV